MAHFAQIDENNVVIQVLVVSNMYEHRGEDYLANDLGLGGRWIKTSFNAVGGKKRNPETNKITEEPGFRKNYAGIGYKYDEELDAFIPPKPFNSWILNVETCWWEAPTLYPQDGRVYKWVEDDLNWQLLESEV
jgi:hypothetical protein